MIKSIQFLIVDNQPRARQSLKALLATWFEIDRFQEATTGREAVRLVEESQPDIVLMDARMPEMNGIEATRLIKTRWSRVKVIVLSIYSEYEDEALAVGADAFICKAEPAGKLLATISRVITGKSEEDRLFDLSRDLER